MDFFGRDFLRILDFSEDELRYMLATAKKFKELKRGEYQKRKERQDRFRVGRKK